MSVSLLLSGLIGAVLLLSENGATAEDSRRPIWNIAHMVNAAWQADEYVSRGANALEADVAFGNSGEARWTHHGIPCDCFRRCTRWENFGNFLNHVRHLTTPGDSRFKKRLVMLFLDLKVNGLSQGAQIYAGESVALKLLKNYWNYEGESGGQAYVLLSFPSIENMRVLASFQRALKMHNATQYEEKVGYDFSGNENLNEIHQSLISFGVTKHIWQGDGITNCLPRGTSRLLSALDRRDYQQETTQPNKVYWWTVDKVSTMRRTLRLGVDALITNYPESLIDVLNEESFAKDVRLATMDDSPWSTHPVRSAKLITAIESRSGKLLDYDEEEEEILYNS